MSLKLDCVTMNKTLTLIAGLLLAPLVNLPAAEATRTPYNVLFIAIDDLNDWVGAFGGVPQAQSATPRMDQFAQSGSVVFQQASSRLHGFLTLNISSGSTARAGAPCFGAPSVLTHARAATTRLLL
jgi:hypothetical protein